MQDLNDKITGNSLTAAEWNEMPSELQNIIEAFGIVLSSGDLDQVGKGIANYVATGNAYTVGGSPNALTLTTVGAKQQPTAYLNGIGVGFTPTANNTGAVTVDLNGLGPIDLVQADGTAMIADDLVNGITLIASFRSGSNDFRVIGSSDNFAKSAVISQQIFIVAGVGTWNRPVGVKYIVVEFVGGGGGGGSSGLVTNKGGGGGGSGGYIREAISVVSAPAVGFTVGAGGAGGTGNGNGVTGVDTTFGLTLAIARGGVGGFAGVGANPRGGTGGISTGPSTAVKISGNAGARGATAIASGGEGAGSYFGGGTVGGIGAGLSANAVDAGAGGAGGRTQTGAGFDGGDGAPGLIVVTEYR